MERQIPSTSSPLAISSARRGEVDAVEARPLHRRRRDPDVDLGRAGLAQHPDQRPLGVAAHDRVVDHHQALAGDHVAQRVQLEPDAELADGLAGLDEGTPDVGVLDQPLPVRDAGRLGVPDRRGRARLGHRDHQVGLGRVLPGQRTADLDPDRVQPRAGDQGVRPGQVDVLEQAALRLRRARTAGCGGRARRWPAARRARPPGRTRPRRCPARRSRWPPPSRVPAGRAPAGGCPADRARRTGSPRP